MYPQYIEEKTGYRIDLYNDIRIRCNKIIKNGAIASVEEFNDIDFMNLVCTKDRDCAIDPKILQNLLDEYKERNSSPGDILTLVTQNGLIKIGDTKYKDVHPKKTKSQKDVFRYINSPNHKNWISLQGSGKGEFALTFLVVGVDGGSGSVYCARGENLNIKASWEDNENIIIETSGKYETLDCYKKITTRTSKINIKYIEN